LSESITCKVIAIINQKGGVGKTTLAINIATKLYDDKYKVLLIDSDTQESATDWSMAGNNKFKVIGRTRPTLEEDIIELSKGYDWVIIDGVPQIENMAKAAIKCADLVIVPVQPSQLDVWASLDLIDIIKARQAAREGKPLAYFCVSQKVVNSLAGNKLDSALKDLGFPVMKGFTCQRTAYKESISIGKTVFDTRNWKAKQEITNIVKEIKEILK
jgi:chromosome partitioning protein